MARGLLGHCCSRKAVKGQQSRLCYLLSCMVCQIRRVLSQQSLPRWVDEHACESWNSGAVSGVQQMGSYPGVWHAIPLLPSQMTCWYSACVVHASPVATVVSALCLGVVCWIVVPSLRSRTLVPLVLWALVRCDMQSAVSGSWDVTDDVFWSPLFAATACLGRQVQAYAGAAAASLFVLRRGGGGRPSGTCHVLIGMRWVGGFQLLRQLLRSCGRSRSSVEVERLR